MHPSKASGEHPCQDDRNASNALIRSFNFSRDVVPTMGAETAIAEARPNQSIPCGKPGKQSTVFTENPSERDLGHADAMFLR